MIFRSSSSRDSSSSSRFSFSSDENLDQHFSSSCFPSNENEILKEPLYFKTKAINTIINDIFEPVTPFSILLERMNMNVPCIDNIPSKTTSISGPSIKKFAIETRDIKHSIVEEPNVPETPFFLIHSNFSTNKSLNEIILILKNTLSNPSLHIDYEFDENQSCFNAVYVNGSRFTDLIIRIFKNVRSSGFIIEFQRLNRNSCGIAFDNVFKLIKSVFHDDTPTSVAETRVSFVNLDFSYSSSSELGGCEIQPTDEEIDSSIQEIFKMIQDPCEDTKLEALRMLYDSIELSDVKERVSGTFDCIKILNEVLKSGHILLKQLAIFILANLSECQSGINSIVKSKETIPLLISFISDGPYYTVAMRRESARAIANVAAKKAHEIIQMLSSETVSAWKKQITNLVDPIIKDRSQRTISSLHSILA